ncbi:hypothetical protein J2Z31_005216 [Sinorhizobium kostiense]|uniref:Uncharacterized protein n=1 Tax=Sinorhizobium kostiense TaxID=76747 RepID=A0ABS4R700_9HYPH|nr:hypothetical protein [Sinorhizobium kostiense]MBP2238675.1 hypothetical protein [Sinorhizobium kostiense]
MTATLTFHPLGNADCIRIDFADGKKMLIDYADMRNPNDPYDKRIDLPEELKSDLRAAKRDYYDVVCFTHLDDDHCCGSGDFFWLDHAAKYQGEGRIKINELWVPAAAILEDGCEDSARIVRQEARHRLRQGHGIRVFSRPKKLREWLEKQGLTLESRAHLITDAGQTVPGFSKFGPEHAEFFIHSPFGWRQDDNGVVDRNQDSVVFQATFLEGGRETYALFMSDINYDSIDQIVITTKRHGREDRLLWDIFKIPHHCSYLSIGPNKGEDKTVPTEHVAWLCETQGRDRHIMLSTSKPMPVKGSAEDDDVQPPHRQAGNYYKAVAREADGSFKVTMETPSIARPKPTKIEVNERGARLLMVSAAAGAASIVSTPARAG